MNVRKLSCAYHPPQLITNFCAHKQCLLPLCPACIAGHTQTHIEKSTLPKFQSIQQTCLETHSYMQLQTKQLQELKSAIVQIFSKKENGNRDILNILMETKKNIVLKIQNLFEEIGKEMMAVMEGKEKEMGLLGGGKFGEVWGRVEKEERELEEGKMGLGGEECLSYLIRYLGKEKEGKDGFIRGLEREVRVSQEYHSGIEIKEDIVGQIQNIVRGGIRMKFVLPTLENKTHVPTTIVRPPSQPSHTLTRTPSVILDQSRNSLLTRQNSLKQIPYRRSIEFIPPFQPSAAVIRPSSSHNRRFISPPFPFATTPSLLKQNQTPSLLKTSSKIPTDTSTKPRKGLQIIKPSP